LYEEKHTVSEPFLGQIMLVPYNFAPRGWAFCNGQILPIAQNTALFSLLGTTYGGNGQTTFALPDLRGRVPNSSGQGPGLENYELGQVGGVESVTLTTNQLPAHTHQIDAHTHQAPAHTHEVTALTDAASTGDPTSNLLASAARGTNVYAPPSANTKTMASTMVQSGGGLPTSSAQPAIQQTGGNQPFDIRTPYLTLNYCIALEGIFPSRN
jgi:microcystin-dependent protein